MKKLIAVYGTLKKGLGNHRVMGESKFLGTHVTAPNFTMYSAGGFPIVSPRGQTQLLTEIYEVTNQNDLKNIYRLEGYSGVRDSKANWYNTIDIETPFGKAEMFVMDKQMDLTIVETGVW